MKTKIFFLFFVLFSITLNAKTIKVMLLTGKTDKYHNWEVTSSYLEAIIEQQEIFKMDVVLIPEDQKEFEEFVPNFSKYDVVVLNINMPDWNDKAKTEFESYVKKGGGVVVVHEANNAFSNWKEYNQITGLGGWGGRNEKDGPYIYWKDGQIVSDNSPGVGGSHGKRVPFVINVRDSLHPITNGIPTKWLHQNDELYANLRGPAQNIHVLATAFSNKETGGSNKEEPVLFTVSYGKGRIFHTVLGHTGADFSDSVEDVGFQVTLSRGTEWAATGKVKQKLPEKFPDENNVLLNKLLK